MSSGPGHDCMFVMMTAMLIMVILIVVSNAVSEINRRVAKIPSLLQHSFRKIIIDIFL